MIGVCGHCFVSAQPTRVEIVFFTARHPMSDRIITSVVVILGIVLEIKGFHEYHVFIFINY